MSVMMMAMVDVQWHHQQNKGVLGLGQRL